MANRKKDPKGILRKGKEITREKTKSATFDEMNIIATLHPSEKDYGFMKVDEPPTPYNYDYEPDKEKPVNASLLADKLKGVSDAPVGAESKKFAHAEEEDPETRKAMDEKRKEFESKRKAHYNEYFAAKLSRSATEEEDLKVPAPAPPRSSPVLVFCGVDNCPGHKKGSTEKCPSSKGKSKTGSSNKTSAGKSGTSTSK